MNYRDRFNNLFAGKPVDKVPFVSFMSGGINLIDKFKAEGHVAMDTTRADLYKQFGYEGKRGIFLDPNLFIYPEFPETDIERKASGVRKYNNKWNGISMANEHENYAPITIEGPVTDRKSWDAIKGRLNPSDMGRYQDNWDELVKAAIGSGEPVYTGDLPCGFFGAPRELFGPTNALFMFYDDPSLMHDVLDTLCDLWIGMTRRMQELTDKYIPQGRM
ncbi:MAG: hypothetical protein HN368_08165 [Spirochaetales bacterium]|jgi:hypothetical protein|nr:hypothetical protein [Spirochaetales bacterium]